MTFKVEEALKEYEDKLRDKVNADPKFLDSDACHTLFRNVAKKYRIKNDFDREQFDDAAAEIETALKKEIEKRGVN